MPPELESGSVATASKAAGIDRTAQKAVKREGGSRAAGQSAAKRAKVRLREIVLEAFLSCCRPVAMQRIDTDSTAPFPLPTHDLHRDGFIVSLIFLCISHDHEGCRHCDLHL